MAGIGGRTLATAVVALAAATAGLFLTVWRPHFEPSTQQAPRIAVPYTTVQYTVGDARRAFAAVGVRLVPKSRITGVVSTIGTPDDSFEVDVFGDPARVNAVGFVDSIRDAHGTYVRFPKTCTTGLPDAARWHANVRVVVGCANAKHAHLLAVGTRALAKL